MMETDYDAIQDEREHQQRHRMQTMMNRFKPGGDKYESIRADEQWEHVEEDRIQAEEERLRMDAVDASEQEDAE